MEMEEAASKASESDDFSRKKRPAPASDDDEEEGDYVAGRGVEEDMVEEVMKRLEDEINGPDFVPYSSCSFITINGNEESCGPSFSDSASTVMASIDTGGIRIMDLVGPTLLYGGGVSGIPAVEGGVPSAAAAADMEESDDDEWLASVLGGPGFEFEEDLGF